MKRISSLWKVRAHAQAVERRRVKRLRRRASGKAYPPPEADETILQTPIEFSLENYHEKVTSFLKSLRNSTKAEESVCIDFRPTKRMVAGATLLFFSELHRLQSIYPQSKIRCIPSKDDTVNQVLQHLGIFDALGYKSSVVPTRRDVVDWRKASSSEVDGDKVGPLIEAYKSLEGANARHAFRAVTEAMMNAVNHAYIEPRQDGLPPPPEKKWWMFCREDGNKVVIAVCDLGIGIPKSLPLRYPLEMIAEAMSYASRGRMSTDAKLIEAAMEIRRTRTGKRGRGRGLQDIKRLIDHVPGGRLYIFSNRGMIKYSDGAYQRRNYSNSIKGTVVIWIIPLKGEKA